jgi:hypothetical protein
MRKRIDKKSLNPAPAAERGTTDQQPGVNRISTGTIDVLQRKCAACEEEEKVQRKPMKPFLQKKENQQGAVAGNGVSEQINSSKGKGQSIDDSTRNFMETRFGTDFNNVRIHTDDAGTNEPGTQRQSFTVGNDIYFNEGEYKVNTDNGKQLLAHELTHTLQQGTAIRRTPKDRFGRPLGFFPTPEQEEYDRQSLAIGLDMQAEILREPVYQSLKQESKDRVRRILDKAMGKPPGFAKGQRYYYLQKLNWQ